MPYVFLLVAIALEVVATSLLKASDGFTRLIPTLSCIVGYVASFALVSRALQHFELGMVYAVWSGLGTVAVVSVGVLAFGESLDSVKVGGTALVVAGVVLLNLRAGV